MSLMAKMIARGDFPLLFIGQPLLFPVESYLMAPLIEWLPRNVFGARYLMLLQGLLSLYGFLLISREAYSPGKRWPAVVLILFPSTYFLMLTSGYSPPHYPMMITLTWVSVLLLMRWRQNRKIFFLALIGVLSGLSFSNHMVSITISAGIFLLVLFDGNAEHKAANIFMFIAGFLVGTAPYYLAIWTIPGAYGELHNLRTLSKIILAISTSLFTDSVPRSMGINPIFFPDMGGEYLNWGPALQQIFSVGYLALLLFIAIERGYSFWKAIAGRHIPKLELVDLALVTSMANIGIFATLESWPSEYRYLLPAVLFFPFLMAHAFEKSMGKWNILVSGTIFFLVLFNVSSAVGVIKFWTHKDLLQKCSDTPGIRDLLKYLHVNHINHCYASYWLNYRITFESDEKIICAQVYNERFSLWPVPYKREVDKDTNSVFVLRQTSRFTPLLFMDSLEKANIGYKRTIVELNHDIEPVNIYSDFHFLSSATEQHISNTNYSLATNGTLRGVEFLHDSDLSTAWKSLVEKGQTLWLEADFVNPQLVSGLTLFHLRDSIQPSGKITVLGKQVGDSKNGWQPIEATVPFFPVGFLNKHPVYDDYLERIDLQPTLVTALRIAVNFSESQGEWGLAEVQFLSKISESPTDSPGWTVPQ